MANEMSEEEKDFHKKGLANAFKEIGNWLRYKNYGEEACDQCLKTFPTETLFKGFDPYIEEICDKQVEVILCKDCL